MKRFFLCAIAVAAAGLTLPAQNRMTYSVVSPESGHVALGLAIRKLNVSGTFMQAPAHPDDETNALFALFTHGMGLRSVDVQNNRGEGGQNEIGPELFHDIGVLRTSELVAAHRIDGAEQYFTRAIDYGYSFDPEEVINKWGRDAIVGDYVRLIRMLRPDVLVTMNIQGRGGDRAHEATTVLAREAYRAAGDPNRYPEQLSEGLRAWQPKKLYFSAGFGVIGRSGRGGSIGREEWIVLDVVVCEQARPAGGAPGRLIAVKERSGPLLVGRHPGGRRRASERRLRLHSLHWGDELLGRIQDGGRRRSGSGLSLEQVRCTRDRRHQHACGNQLVHRSGLWCAPSFPV